MNKRLEANRQIINFLSKIVEENPDWRFQQILQNVSVNVRSDDVFACKDLFYEESDETLDRMQKCVYVALNGGKYAYQ